MSKVDCEQINIKEFFTTQELLNKVKNQNLLVPDENKFFYLVDKLGYEKLIMGYRAPFGDCYSDKNIFSYYKDVEFDFITHLYNFDFELRLLTFKYITIIEEKIKNQLSNIICSNFGTNHHDFLKTENFNGEAEFLKIKESIEKSINVVIDTYQDSVTKGNEPKIINHSIINAYISTGGQLPFWSISQILTLGDITSILFNINDKLCSQLSRTYNIQPNILRNYIQRVNLFRNVCAHHQRLYCYRTINTLKTRNLKSLFSSLNVEYDEDSHSYKRNTRDYMSLIIVFKRFLDQDDFREFCDGLEKLLNILQLKLPEEYYKNIVFSMGIHDNIFDVMAYDYK